MSGLLDSYAASVAAGMREGVSDIARSAIADIGDTYQEILMADSPIGPPDGLTGTMETVTEEIETEEALSAMEADDPAPQPAPEITMDA